MDGRSSFEWSVARRSWVAAALCLLLLPFACRVPAPPVLKREPLVIMYDSAKEAELRSGKPLRFGLDGMDRYVDTLAEPVAVREWSADHCTWEVFVATNRGWLESPDDPEAANRVLDEVHYGRCEATLPRDDVGLRMELEEKRKKSAVIAVASASSKSASATSTSSPVEPAGEVEATRLSESAFLDGVSDQVRRSRQKDLLLFVHGFNVSFEAAVARTAQVALKIPFNGAVVSYCWPTQCGVFKYDKDEPINKASVAPFAQFLTTLREGIPPETRIHIMVHSMGNRIVMECLDNLPTPQGRKPFGHVVLCAPDVGHADFRAWAPGVVEQAERVTLYANSGDSALIVSKGLHNEMRAGDAEVPLVVPGVETIDCSRIEDSLMGHSYYGDNRDVTTDLFMLIKEDLPPSKRFFLEKQKSPDGPYWQFARHAPTVMCTWHFDE
ncbi:MAG: alpha/beta hydrolase [Planctomycetota bacterium]